MTNIVDLSKENFFKKKSNIEDSVEYTDNKSIMELLNETEEITEGIINNINESEVVSVDFSNKNK